MSSRNKFLVLTALLFLACSYACAFSFSSNEELLKREIVEYKTVKDEKIDKSCSLFREKFNQNFNFTVAPHLCGFKINENLSFLQMTSENQIDFIIKSNAVNFKVYITHNSFQVDCGGSTYQRLSKGTDDSKTKISCSKRMGEISWSKVEIDSVMRWQIKFSERKKVIAQALLWEGDKFVYYASFDFPGAPEVTRVVKLRGNNDSDKKDPETEKKTIIQNESNRQKRESNENTQKENEAHSETSNKNKLPTKEENKAQQNQHSEPIASVTKEDIIKLKEQKQKNKNATNDKPQHPSLPSYSVPPAASKPAQDKGSAKKALKNAGKSKNPPSGKEKPDSPNLLGGKNLENEWVPTKISNTCSK